MSNEMNMHEIVAHNARIVADDLFKNGIPNDYGFEALRWLENYIDERRETLSEKAKDSLHATVGAYLGECLCRAYNGKWVENEHGWGVEIDGGTLVAFPFAKVAKWIASGESGDSFVSMFRTTPALLDHIKNKNRPKDER